MKTLTLGFEDKAVDLERLADSGDFFQIVSNRVAGDGYHNLFAVVSFSASTGCEIIHGSNGQYTREELEQIIQFELGNLNECECFWAEEEHALSRDQIVADTEYLATIHRGSCLPLGGGA